MMVNFNEITSSGEKNGMVLVLVFRYANSARVFLRDEKCGLGLCKSEVDFFPWVCLVREGLFEQNWHVTWTGAEQIGTSVVLWGIVCMEMGEIYLTMFAQTW